jgi:hypothetical protein
MTKKIYDIGDCYLSQLQIADGQISALIESEKILPGSKDSHHKVFICYQ